MVMSAIRSVLIADITVDLFRIKRVFFVCIKKSERNKVGQIICSEFVIFLWNMFSIFSQYCSLELSCIDNRV